MNYCASIYSSTNSKRLCRREESVDFCNLKDAELFLKNKQKEHNKNSSTEYFYMIYYLIPPEPPKLIYFFQIHELLPLPEPTPQRNYFTSLF